MNMRVTVTPRSITQHEIAVIRAAFEKAARVQLEPTVLERLGDLRVVERCGCGCDSVDFVEYDAQRPWQPIADGTGTTPAGTTIGLIIWGTTDAITGIEVYALDDNADLRLPVENSIRAWEEVPSEGKP